MRPAAKTTFVLIAVAALCLGAFSAAAVAAKKSTEVIFFANNPQFNPGGEVKAKGTLHTITACKPQRVVKLQVLDANGEVLATIDEDDTPNSSGNWKLSGHLPTNLPAGTTGTNSVRVKVKKRTAGKFVCKAGVSISVPIPQ